MKIFLTVLVVVFCLPLGLFGQVIYVVNTTDDLDDGVCDGVHCSLREAINASNEDNTASNIHFSIIGNGQQTIFLSSHLPRIIDDSTNVDATTQPNWYLGKIRIEGYGFISENNNQSFFGLEIYGGVFSIGGNHNIIGSKNKPNIIYTEAHQFAIEIRNFSEFNNITNNEIIRNWNYCNTSSYDSNYGILLRFRSEFNIIEDNIIQGYSRNIYIQNADNNTIKNNIIGTDSLGIEDKSRINQFSNTECPDIGINIFRSNYSIIEGNTIANMHKGIVIDGLNIQNYTANNNLLFENKIYCTQENVLLETNTSNNNKSSPVITKANLYTIEGTSESGDTIYLYYDNKFYCPTLCNPKHYFGKTMTDINGDWSYQTPDSLGIGYTVVANASNSISNSSEFSSCFTITKGDINSYTVNSLDDVDDGVCDMGHCSLREAIISSNMDNGYSEISFNIGGLGPWIIKLESELPEISEKGLELNGASQPNWEIGKIILESNINNSIENGLVISTSNIDVFGVYVRDFLNCGVKIGNDSTIYNINIGQETGGNIFSGNTENNLEIKNVENFLIKNNLVGINSIFLPSGLSNKGIEVTDCLADSNIIRNNLFSTHLVTDIDINNSKLHIELCSFNVDYLDNRINHSNLESAITCNNSFYNRIINNKFNGYNEAIAIINNSNNNLVRYNIYQCCLNKVSFNLNHQDTLKSPIILSSTTYGIRGTSAPYSTIELYKDTTFCSTNCDATLFLGETQSDQNGDWAFSNPIVEENDKITSIAHKNSLTSEFCKDCSIVVGGDSLCTEIYYVNTITDVNDGYCSKEHCSLREAIHAANNDGSSSEIYFDLSGNTPFIIYLNDFLPKITEDSFKIDGKIYNMLNIGDIVIDGSMIVEGNRALDHTDSGLYFDNSVSEVSGLKLQNLPLGITVTGINNHSVKIGSENYGNILNQNVIGILASNADNIEIIGNYISNNKPISPDYSNSSGIFLTNSVENSIIKKNIIINNKSPAIDLYYGSNNNIIENNYIGTDSTGTKQGGNNTAMRIFQANGNLIQKNIIAYNTTGVSMWSINEIVKENKFRENEFICNGSAISIASGDQNNILPPTISSISNLNILGTSLPSSLIEIYKVSDSICPGSVCQGGEFIGNEVTDNNGQWTIQTPSGTKLGDRFTATATDLENNTSEFSSCFIVLPDDCYFAQPLPTNNNACSSVGIVLDLKELTASSPPPASSCGTMFAGNDAWYKIVVPSTGNFLVRTNTNNTVVPIIELYTACGNTPLSKCGILDTLPYIMTFENYIPGDSLLLRVWDKDNAIVNSAGSALLHLTAHKLDSLKENWIVCDYENLISNNPTNLSRREASNFILSYEPNTPQSVMDADSIAFTDMMEMEKKKSCSCGTEELQLWGTDSPVTLDGRKRYAKTRGSVDTTNYNYIFETVEFQVNSYAIGQQHSTDIGMDEEGNFVMVWKDEQRKHNYGRVYLSSGNPVSVEFQIGSSSKTQYDTKVEMLDNGEFITVWHEIDPTQAGAAYAIYGLLFYANGEPKSPVFEISLPSANTSPKQDIRDYAQYGTNAQVAAIADGSFIVVWQVGGNVFAQRFDAAANLVGSIIEVGNTVNAGINPNPAISINTSGAFIITWTGIDEEGNGIYAQRFSATGTPLEDAFLVNTTENKNQSNPVITFFDDNSFIITWESFDQFSSASNYDVYAQRFNATANKIGSEFLINTYTDDAQRRPSIAHFDNGNFLIAWSSFGQDGYEEGIYAKLFDQNGVSIMPSFDDSDRGSEGHEFRMNAYNEPQQDKPKTATNGESIFMGAWEDGHNDGYEEGVFAQRYETIISNNTQVFKAIGTATPSTLLGDQKIYASIPYNPGASVKKAKVAIIDTGVKNQHNLLNAAIWNNPEANDTDNCLMGDDIGYDFVNRSGSPEDLDGHGTQVNGILTDGFNTEVKLELMNLKFHELNNGSVFDAICAIYYAVDNGANVINLSWGFEASEEPVILKKALQYASDNDVLIVTTAGNTSKNNDEINKYPANLDIPNMIVVTSFHYKAEPEEYKLSNYASYGKNNVDIAAYGYVETASKDGGTTEAAGTSMAAPAVARTAAMIKGLHPILTAAEIKECILFTVKTIANFNNLVATGGILQHNAALECAQTKAELIINDACPTSGLVVNSSMTKACSPSAGAIDLSFSGNDPNPTFLWSTGDTSQNINNLMVGDYSVTVTDTARCEQVLDITISNDCSQTCLTNLVINDIDMNGGLYHSDNTITSAGTIEVDSNVIFKAAESITLTPGFNAKAGSEFLATIENCTNSLREEIAESRTALSIEEPRNSKVKIYPNPTQSVLNVEVNKPTIGFDLELFDVVGRRLNAWQVLSNKNAINVSDLNSGIYILRIDKELIKKFVVGKK